MDHSPRSLGAGIMTLSTNGDVLYTNHTRSVSQILRDHGWTCGEEDFTAIVTARCNSLHRERSWIKRSEQPRQSSAVVHTVQNRAPWDVDRVRRRSWGPMNRTVRYFVADDAVPSFLQALLPSPMANPDEEEEMEEVRTFLRTAYWNRTPRRDAWYRYGQLLGGLHNQIINQFHPMFRPRGRERFFALESDHGTWIEINAVGEEEDEVRFSVRGWGPWNVVTHWEEDFEMVCAAPLAASPTRHRWAVECFENPRF